MGKDEKTLEYIKSIIGKSASEKEAGEKVKSFFEYLKSLNTMTKQELKDISDISTLMLKNFENIESFDWKHELIIIKTRRKLDDLGQKLKEKKRRERESKREYTEEELKEIHDYYTARECMNPPYYKASCD